MKRNLINFLVLFALVLPFMVYAQNNAGQSHLGIHAGGFQMMGGEESSEMGLLGGFNFGYLFTDRFGFDLSFDAGSAAPGQDTGDMDYKTYIYPISLGARFFLKENAKFSPYLTLGSGLLFWNVYDITDEDESFIPINPEGKRMGKASNNIVYLLGGLGSLLYLTEDLALDLGVRYDHLLDDDKDFSGLGDKHSSIIEARLGLNFVLRCNVDTDGDGILDRDDLDPLNPEDFDAFEDEDGAPDLDNDMDGILDVDDGAINDPEDFDDFEDEDGIPDLDNDGDSIVDKKDKAPNHPEDFDGFEDFDGAPDLDNDMDGILDVDDRCPNEPENINEFMDDDGCPDVKPEIVFEEESPIILEGVTFATSSAVLTEGAKDILDKVVLVLVDYPDINLDIHGYTDSIGDRDYNVMLSKQRAESVLNYLIENGIAPERLSAKGFGPDNPVASNDSKEGRAKNRRIEFIRVD